MLVRKQALAGMPETELCWAHKHGPNKSILILNIIAIRIQRNDFITQTVQSSSLDGKGVIIKNSATRVYQNLEQIINV